MQMPSKSPSFPLLQRGTCNAKYLGNVSLQGRIHAPFQSHFHLLFSKPIPSPFFKANSIPPFSKPIPSPLFQRGAGGIYRHTKAP